MNITTGKRTFFEDIDEITYEGKGSDNPLAFKYYNPEEKVDDKTMQEHLRFAVAYWHTFNEQGGDPFGRGTRTWMDYDDALDRARAKMDAAFEFSTKLQVPFDCFHEVDRVDEAESSGASEERLQSVVDYARQTQDASGVQLLWATANLFSHRTYMTGAATNPDCDVIPHAGAQVKRALD